MFRIICRTKMYTTLQNLPPRVLSFFSVVVILCTVNSGTSKENFIETLKLTDGEVVTKVSWNNLTAIQTTVGEYRLQQISDGKQLIQLWSVNDNLLDCDFDEEEDAIDKFKLQFDAGRKDSRKCFWVSNGTCESYINETKVRTVNLNLPLQFSTLLKKDALVEQCRNLHEQMRYKYSNLQNKRWKRSDLLLFPGTNWCGSGSRTTKFSELGPSAAADRCCRDHDHCKHTIAPFSSKYHLFNYRFHTVSHCDCDERFRSCLKKTNTGVSNLIGRLYFNIAQIKCFVFKKDKICRKRSWWGICLKMKKIRRAYFKDDILY